MKKFIGCSFVFFSLLLSGCMTPAEELAYDRAVCSFDSGTFVELVPEDEAYQNCMELQYSGIGPDDDPDFGSLVEFQLFDEPIFD
jgi:hypothetical protein